MRNIIISMVVKHLNLDATELGSSGSRVIGDYRIIKSVVPRNYNGDTNNFGIQNRKMMMKSSLVYDVQKKELIKNRNGQLGGIVKLAAAGFNQLKPLFLAIDDIVSDTDYNDLVETHRSSVLLEAIYLTDTIYKYPSVDMVEYQLTRYMYGRELQKNTLKEIYMKFPEKLI